MCNLQAARLQGEPRQPDLLLAGGQPVSAAARVYQRQAPGFRSFPPPAHDRRSMPTAWRSPRQLIV